jgi:nucleotide-binding universal stress UspA family protein
MDDSFIPGSVVVGVDGSPGSDVALAWAAAQAAAHRRPLALVHGTGALVVTDFAFDLDDARRAMLAVGRRVVDHALELVPAADPALQVTVHLELEDPRLLLLRLAAEASLLVVGSRGRGPVTSLLLGSVSVGVSGHAPCPVAVVRPGASSAGQQDAARPVVLGTDATPASDEATRVAFELASWTGRPLTVLHALGDVRELPYFDLLGADQLRELRSGIERQLAEATAGFTEKFPDVPVLTRTVVQSPGKALRSASEEAAVVVVGARSRGTFARRVWGSVSRSTVEQAHCTVVVVPEAARP